MKGQQQQYLRYLQCLKSQEFMSWIFLVSKLEEFLEDNPLFWDVSTFSRFFMGVVPNGGEGDRT